jgi:hypothetical protein
MNNCDTDISGDCPPKLLAPNNTQRLHGAMRMAKASDAQADSA